MLPLISFALLITASHAFMPALTPRRHLISVPKMGKMDVSFGELDGTPCRIGIIKTRWNKEIIDSLSDGIKTTLKDLKVEDDNVFETEVPGAFELPMAAKFLAMSGTVDAIICVGCLIKGDTQHFEYISQAASSGIMSVGLQTSTPVVFGVLTVNTEEQAKARAMGEDNHGISWAQTAVEMAQLRQQALGKGVKRSVGGLGFGQEGGSESAKPGFGAKPGEKKTLGF